MTSLPASVPYPQAAEICRWTLRTFSDLRNLRAALREAVSEMTTNTGDGVERMALVVTELATNALRHGLPPTVVRLLREGDRLIIDVADHDRQATPAVDAGRPLGAGGLGLQLARTFATDVGWYSTDVTKHVWASFPS
ncbi:ATP-binding protein [Actinoplanes sp. NPDC026619]|uniref:ATP-binding protein n=1 Tax=Actinoplanes sp. NPDC026619 TaxID=3155798 RepID=UPI0033C2CFEA